MDRPREEWVPPEERREAQMRENTGEDSAHSFVYFPKQVLNGFHCMEIPVGARLYRGIRTSCENVVDPAACPPKEQNDQCWIPAWYADRKTAKLYASTMPDPDSYVYTFEVTTPLILINLMDVRNIERLLRFATHFLLDAERQQGTPGLTEQQIQNASDWIDRLRLDAATLISVTQYPWKKLSPMLIKFLRRPGDVSYTSILLYDEKRRGMRDPQASFPAPPEEFTSEDMKAFETRIAHELAMLAEEFGDQDAISRRPVEKAPNVPNAGDLIRSLQDLLPHMPLHGYYAPTVQAQKGGNFHREVCLFQSAGLLRHVKDDPLDGCVKQQKKGGSSGSRWPTRRNTGARGRRGRGLHYTHKASIAEKR